MKTRKREGRGGVIVGAGITLSACGAAGLAQAQEYAIIDVGHLGNPNTVYARAINSKGVVAGESKYVPGDQDASTHAFRWVNGRLEDIGLGLSCCSFAKDINELGEVIGSSLSGDYVPTFWDSEGNGSLVPNWDPAYGGFQAINNLAEFVGEASPSGFGGNRVPVYYRDQTLFVLGTFGGPRGSAQGVNDASVIVGMAEEADLDDRAFRWENGVMTALPGISDNEDDSANAINELGEIAGTVRDDGGDYHTALWDSAGTLHILEQNPGATDSNGASINERGDVLGLIKINGVWDGAIWTAEGEEILFSDVLPPHHKWTIDIPWDINDIGMICGQGNYPPYTGLFDQRGFVMVPVTPMCYLAGPAPGVAGTRNTLRASGVTPGKKVYFVYGLVGGGSVIPGCDLAETLAAIQIENAKVIGSATANAQGIATLNTFVPDAARNAGDVLIQAVIPGDCKISNLVMERFE